MSNTFTAQELSDFYQKVADGGEVEFRVNCTNKHWFSSSGSPCLSSARQDWRIKPTKKVIDLSVLIESGVDCEFSDDFSSHLTIGTLLRITDCPSYPYETDNSKDEVHGECRPRMNHKHAWQGGECPLPEGFMVKVFLRDGCVNSNKVTNFSQWSHTKSGNDIIAFEVLGLADGYVMPWEQDDD
tara:strand:- start:216 stop:767 length:552 start_codon:yes stop_codon:yes gene_type:complete